MAGSPDFYALSDGAEAQRSLYYRIGQGVVIVLLGLVFATTAMALFVHGEALNQPPPPAHHAAPAHTHKPYRPVSPSGVRGYP